MIAGKFRPGTGVQMGPQYNWFDWESASIWMREGEKLFTEADPSLREILKVAPSAGRAAFLRAQGKGHAAHQEWREAADNFEALLQVNQQDDWDVATLDFLACGALLAELGDNAGFDRVRQEAVTRYSGTGNRVIAERIIKMCVLRPMDPKLLAELAPMAAKVASPFGSDEENLQHNRSYNAWSAVTLGFLEGRRGNFAKAADLCRRSVDSADDLPSSTSIGHVGLAMCLFQLGEADAARPELQQGRDLIENRLKNQLNPSNWHDWLYARVALREATSLLSGPNPPKEPKTK
jgi:tetratricopeptide (TPR) repeat protein